MDYQELLRKYITERQESEQKLVGGEVIELTLFASWLNKNAAQQTLALDLALPPAKDDVYKIEWLDGDTVRLTPSQ